MSTTSSFRRHKNVLVSFQRPGILLTCTSAPTQRHVRSYKLERVTHISVAVGSDTVQPRLSCRGCCLSQSVCLKQDAIHLASGSVVDLRGRVCDSHFIRVLSSSELASQNSTSRQLVSCSWRIWSCGRGKHSRTQNRNRQQAIACTRTHHLADHNRRAGVCGCVDCSGWPCPNAIARDKKPRQLVFL